MNGPIKDTPLALCYRKSVKYEEQVPQNQCGFAKTGREIPTLSLKHSPDHRWFYYPEMTTEETIVFKQIQADKQSATEEV